MPPYFAFLTIMAFNLFLKEKVGHFSELKGIVRSGDLVVVSCPGDPTANS